jgi:hypothetical protein
LATKNAGKERSCPALMKVLHGDVLKSDLGELFPGCVDNMIEDADFLKKALDFSINRKSWRHCKHNLRSRLSDRIWIAVPVWP